MILGSVCSGIEAASVAWHPLGWRAAFFSEIDAFPCRVLAHHYPDVPNLGDMTRFKEWPNADIDVLVGGTPCQSFSVAGLRKGLADPRGNLMLTYGAIARRYRPRWLVWENVPGVLSSGGGRDFGTFLGMLGELGYGFAYRVLDAQYFGVAQRRRRVFVVGCLGDWRRAAAVLLEQSGLRGDPAPRRKAREAVAGTLRAGSGGGCGPGPDEAKQGLLIASDVAPAITSNPYGDHESREGLLCVAHGQGGAEISSNLAPALTCNHEAPYIAHALRADGFDASEDGTGRGTPLVVAETLRGHPRPGSNSLGAIAVMPFDTTQITSIHDRSQPDYGRECHTLAKGQHPPAIAYAWAASASQSMNPSEVSPSIRSARNGEPATGVRRLTPRECERLQGFPDDYTLIPKAKDAPRYKALGNSMAVPVMRWIGQRIAQVDAIETRKAA